MFDILNKAIQEHICLFEGLPYVEKKPFIFGNDDVVKNYEISISENITWHFSISVTKIDRKWYIHYTNRLMGADALIQNLLFGVDHHKHNLIHAMFKKDYKLYFEHFKLFQGQIINNYKYNFLYTPEQCVDRLHELVQKEQDHELNYEENDEYIALHERCKRQNIDMPFGVEI